MLAGESVFGSTQMEAGDQLPCILDCKGLLGFPPFASFFLLLSHIPFRNHFVMRILNHEPQVARKLCEVRHYLKRFDVVDSFR